MEKGSSKMSNWYLQNGKDSDVVISTRVRLARNIKDFNFESRCSGVFIKELIIIECRFLKFIVSLFMFHVKSIERGWKEHSDAIR